MHSAVVAMTPQCSRCWAQHPVSTSSPKGSVSVTNGTQWPETMVSQAFRRLWAPEPQSSFLAQSAPCLLPGQALRPAPLPGLPLLLGSLTFPALLCVARPAWLQSGPRRSPKENWGPQLGPGRVLAYTLERHKRGTKIYQGVQRGFLGKQPWSRVHARRRGCGRPGVTCTLAW